MRMVGIDVGGTFTDLVYADTAAQLVVTHKVATTPEDPSVGMMRGIEELCTRAGIDPADIEQVRHGTTIATNAVLEYDGCEAGMITTRGFRDVVHIGRHQRPQHYSIQQRIPWQAQPLVKRRHRLEVTERATADRQLVLEPLNEDDVRAAARKLKEAGVEAVSVCFLFSYINPAHERRAAAILREKLPDCFVTTSSEVSPQFREFERFTTAAMNAFIGPKVRRYVARLQAELRRRGLKAELRIMRSNGGIASGQLVADLPVLTLLSGPAAGVLGGAWSGGLSGRRNLITFDVGGTSADIGIVQDGRFVEATARDTAIGGYPVMVPMIDIHTIGAGGGSIAHLDPSGAFRVGPRSAGAVPGPAGYGRGGTQPTVTDANLFLGRLDPDNFLGGEMTLDIAASRDAIRMLARRLGLEPIEAAEGVLTVLNANMANAIRSRTVQKGLDPRGFCLVAMGGAGPLHGVEVAALLDIPEVLVPPFPGIASAVGLMTTDLKYDAVRTVFARSDRIDAAAIAADFSAMQEDLAGQIEADGIAPDVARFARAADLRYAGQGYELRVPLPSGSVTGDAMRRLVADFHDRHMVEYGHGFPGNPVEIVNVRLTAAAHAPKLDSAPRPAGGSLSAALVRHAPCVFRTAHGLEHHETPRYRREALPLGEPIAGPAIIMQRDSTTVVPPGAQLYADTDGNLIIRLKG